MVEEGRETRDDEREKKEKRSMIGIYRGERKK